MDDVQRLSVAVLEGEQLLRECLVALLKAGGLEVVLATSDPAVFLAGAAGLGAQIALVGLSQDHRHPEPSLGLGVLRALGNSAPGTRAVVLSSSPDPRRIEAYLRSGASAFLRMGEASVHALRQAIAAAARGERTLPSQVVHPAPGHRLTPREREVLAHVTDGYDNLKIAACLNITERTVKAHMGALYRKVEVENRVQLALAGRRFEQARPA